MKVLIVSGSDKTADSIASLLRADGGVAFGSSVDAFSAVGGADARRKLLNSSFDIIIIDCPLCDEFGNDLAVALCASTTASIILLVKTELAEPIAFKVEPYGVVVIEKPVVRRIFTTALHMASTMQFRLRAMQKDNVRLQQKIEEIRLVDRAKCVLIQYLNMSEQQAHRYIEKQSMDLRTSKTEIAEGIIRNYGS